MNKKDIKILSHLRNDARMSLTRMSKKTSIPISTIFDKIKLLQDDVIKKHTTLLDFNKLGYSTRANIMISVDRESKDPIKYYLTKNPCINSVYKINNGFDFMIEGVFRQIKDMEDFLDTLEQRFDIKDKQSYFIIDELKRESFMTDPELVFE